MPGWIAFAFSGEVRISRKHTCFAYRDELVQDWRDHDLIIRTVDCRAITTSQVPKVVEEWRNPTHRDFRPRNLWSLFNAFTDAPSKKPGPSKPSENLRDDVRTLVANH